MSNTAPSAGFRRLVRRHMHEIDDLCTVMLSTCDLALVHPALPAEVEAQVRTIQSSTRQVVTGRRALVQEAWRKQS